MSDDSKLSIDHMLEMAMGLSMASLFNENMKTASANNQKHLQDNEMNAPRKYLYAIIEGKQQGPFSFGEIANMIQNGLVTPDTYMWQPGMAEWKHAKEITEIAANLGSSTPPAVPENDNL